MGLELAHAQYVAALAAGGVKKGKLPKPLHVPRPTPWVPAPESSITPTPRRRRRATTPAEVIAVITAGFGPSRG